MTDLFHPIAKRLASSFLLVTIAHTFSATAADFLVNSAGDSGPGTLRQAVLDADATPGDDRIVFESALAQSTIVLSSSIQVQAASEEILIDGSTSGGEIHISGNDATRIFEIFPSTEVHLRGLKLTNGKAPDGSSGVDGATPGDGTDGSDGGAIISAGILRVESCNFEQNKAGNGGKGGENQGAISDPGATGGNGGRGGAIANTTSGELTLISSSFSFNQGGKGGDGGNGQGGTVSLPGGGGNGGNGGAIFCEGLGVDIVDCRIGFNKAGNGGFGGIHGNLGTGGDGGNGGNGGGFASDSGRFMMTGTRMVYNFAGDGELGGDSALSANDTGGRGGDGGFGGSIFVFNLEASTSGAHISQSLIALSGGGEGARGGHAGLSGVDGTVGGDGGIGGGIFVFNPASSGVVFQIENTTISTNASGDGGVGGDGVPAGTGGDGGNAGDGGGICVGTFGTPFDLDLRHVTITKNLVGQPGLSGANGIGSVGLNGEGGGIYSSSIPVTLTNSVVADNTANTTPNLDTFTSFGTNVVTGDPQLGPLDLNGSTIESHVPLIGSPLINGGVAIVGIPTEDQRGRKRILESFPDIGAIEVVRQPDLRIGKKTSPNKHRLNNVYTNSGGRPETVKLRGKRSQKFHVSVENDGDLVDSIKLRSNRAKRDVNLKVFRLTGGRKNITAAIQRRGFTFAGMTAGAIQNTQFRVSSKNPAKTVKQTLKIRSFSASPGAGKDAVKAKAKTVR